ncbi:MAG: hypothetical protein II522_03600, partial [Clostridia bacterium]|nr:hypothetical protein [Clostridia bacterium]
MLLQYTHFVDPYYNKSGIPLTQHNLRAYIAKEDDGTKLKFSEDAIDSYLRKNDNIFYDMGPWGMQTLNSELYAFDDIYYLSYSGEVTRTVLGRATLPKLKAGVTLPFATLISTFENYLPEAPIITKKDQDNDGLVNTNSSMPPINEEAAVFRAAEYCQPGIWYQMPIENRNHFSFTGLFVRPDRYLDDIYNLMEIVCNLE